MSDQSAADTGNAIVHVSPSVLGGHCDDLNKAAQERTNRLPISAIREIFGDS